MPDSRLKPVFVYQMQDGDRYGVEQDAIVADVQGKPFVLADGILRDVGCGRPIVIKCSDGYHLDLSNVPPSVRFERVSWSTGKVYRVRDVKGAGCA